MKKLTVDKPFLFSVLILTLGGFFVFTSASLGLLARDGARFGAIAWNQALGLGLGLLALFITSKINYKFWKQYAFYFFVGALLLNLLVFIPEVGFSHNGASRWITFGSFSFQPSEFLKIAFIIYFAAWISHVREKVSTMKQGLLPFLIIIGVVGAVLLAQSDTDTMVVIISAGIAQLLVSGVPWKHIALVCTLALIGLVSIAFLRPYVMERVKTFLNPAGDPQGSGYQIQQSLIAIGSGGLTGRGFGQSVQKFNFLPEPIGDSIFAVSAEEFGFIGSVILILLFLILAFRSLKIAGRIQDAFGGLFIVGIAILIIVESFMNIASMLGIIPLSGMPLLFVSHGGTALVMVLAEMGIVLNISRYQKS